MFLVFLLEGDALYFWADTHLYDLIGVFGDPLYAKSNNNGNKYVVFTNTYLLCRYISLHSNYFVENELIAGFEWNLENPNQIDLTWWVAWL